MEVKVLTEQQQTVINNLYLTNFKGFIFDCQGNGFWICDPIVTGHWINKTHDCLAGTRSYVLMMEKGMQKQMFIVME